MKRFISLLFSFVFLSALMAQENPFEEYDYQPQMATMSGGKYKEFHDRDTIVRIGNLVYNTKSERIIGFEQEDTVVSEATMAVDVVSRWISPDPKAKELPSWSPYAYGLDNPILFIDPDGQFPYTFHVRSFAPPTSFDGFGFKDDGRGFSTSTTTGTTSRIKQQFTVDPTVGSFSKTSPSSDLSHFHGFTKRGSPVGDANASFGTNSVGSSTASIGSYFSGNNPFVIGSPAISVSSAISVTENLKTNQVIVSIDLSSKNFPATEAFVQDADGNSVFLAGAAAFGTPFDLSEGKEQVKSIDLTININEDGIFQSVNAGGHDYSLKEFNALGTGQDAGPKPREEKDN
ncbi:MAG: hypothetical protein RIC95_09520 [Vicingaceae bacterium]